MQPIYSQVLVSLTVQVAQHPLRFTFNLLILIEVHFAKCSLPATSRNSNFFGQVHLCFPKPIRDSSVVTIEAWQYWLLSSWCSMIDRPRSHLQSELTMREPTESVGSQSQRGPVSKQQVFSSFCWFHRLKQVGSYHQLCQVMNISNLSIFSPKHKFWNGLATPTYWFPICNLGIFKSLLYSPLQFCEYSWP
jgi:hypothetical protein